MANLLGLLSGLNPTTGHIAAFFSGFKKMPPPMLRAVVASMDEEMLKKIGEWSQTFADHLNNLGPDALTKEVLDSSMDFGTDDDFFSVMNKTEFKGPKLTDEFLKSASNACTKAIKAKNWADAVWVGMTLSRMLPV